MIGRSLIVFQLGNNKNELHEVNSWDMALTSSPRANKKITEERTNKQWKPEDVVSDAEVEAICNATNCADPKSKGYHKWASDGVRVINISDDPNLYNPMVPIIEKAKAKANKREKAKEELQKYLPELIKLRNAVPDGDITVNIVTPVRVKVCYGATEAISSIKVSIPNSKEDDVIWGHQLVNRTELAKVPEIAAIVNCPLRKAYKDRCVKLAKLLGLTFTDIENEVYVRSREPGHPCFLKK